MNSEEIVTTAYSEMSDGQWKAKGRTYKYRLEISHISEETKKEVIYTVLSNKEDITFEQVPLSPSSQTTGDAVVVALHNVED